jgi:hypothetical protein
MYRDASNPAPVWKLACYDADDKKLAEIIVNARNANIVSHDGFDLVPGQNAKAASSPADARQAEGAPTVKPAIAIRPATAAKPAAAPVAVAASPTPKQKHGLFDRMFHGKDKDKPTPAPSASPAR